MADYPRSSLSISLLLSLWSTLIVLALLFISAHSTDYSSIEKSLRLITTPYTNLGGFPTSVGAITISCLLAASMLAHLLISTGRDTLGRLVTGITPLLVFLCLSPTMATLSFLLGAVTLSYWIFQLANSQATTSQVTSSQVTNSNAISNTAITSIALASIMIMTPAARPLLPAFIILLPLLATYRFSISAISGFTVTLLAPLALAILAIMYVSWLFSIDLAEFNHLQITKPGISYLPIGALCVCLMPFTWWYLITARVGSEKYRAGLSALFATAGFAALYITGTAPILILIFVASLDVSLGLVTASHRRKDLIALPTSRARLSSNP